MARNNLTVGQDVTNQSVYQTSPITPTAGRLVVAMVCSIGEGFPPVAPVPVLAGNGLAWTRVEDIAMATGDRRLSCFVARTVAPTAPTAGPVTISFAVRQDLCAWSIFEYDAVAGDALFAISQHSAAADGGKSTATVNPVPAITANEIAVGALMAEIPGQPGPMATAGPGCSQIALVSANQAFAPSATLQAEDRATPGALEWTWNGNANFLAIVLAVKLPVAPPEPPPAPVGKPLEDLVKRYAPVLFFDPSESFFPSDAKRYVEHCALWAATPPPFDDKQSWGKPPQPIVNAGNLSALAGEPGVFLGDPANTVNSINEERFLEFGGWLDKTGAAQPTVTNQSSHPYANRGEIRSRYANDPVLRDSQFWYHAELFDTGRLNRLAEGQGAAERIAAPDLYRTLNTFKNPALLCYYLFFPAHEQSVIGANIEATEVGSYAGQWACVAMLLERSDPADEYKEPSLIGFTGSPTIAATAQADDETEQRINMKVAQWRPAGGGTRLPEVTDGHPHLYVSRGTHSFYLDNVVHDVKPFPAGKEPQDGGRADAPYEIFGEDDRDTIILLKALAGPAGWLAGILEGVAGAGVYGPVFPDAVGTPDKIPPDTASPGGVTIHPAEIVLHPQWSNPQKWASAQGAVVNGRRYDYLVDRSNQPWWPNDDLKSGYRGRWGQRVENDPLTRRTGVRFPRFWRLFLLAVENGRHHTPPLLP